MIVFDYTPPELCASKNPIAVGVYVGIRDGYDRTACRLYLETAYMSGNFELVHTEIRHYSDRRATFRLETVLDSELRMENGFLERNYPLDFNTGNGPALPQQSFASRRYIAVFKEGNAEGLDLDNYDLKLENRYVIKASQPFEQFDHRLDYPADILSHQPLVRSHVPGQLHWLWAMCDENPRLLVDWTAEYLGTSQQSGQMDFGVNWGWHIPRGIPLHLFWNNFERPELESMTFAFPGTSLPKVKIRRAFEGKEFLREFHFENGLGGYDSFVAYGKGQREESFASDSAVRFLSHDYPTRAENYNDLSRQFQRHNIASRMEQSAELGYRTEAEMDAARAILFANHAFERRNGKMFPIEITSEKLRLNPDGDYRYTFSFTYQYAFENHGLWL